jgi:hypothetical protein
MPGRVRLSPGISAASEQELLRAASFGRGKMRAPAHAVRLSARLRLGQPRYQEPALRPSFSKMRVQEKRDLPEGVLCFRRIDVTHVLRVGLTFEDLQHGLDAGLGAACGAPGRYC